MSPENFLAASEGTFTVNDITEKIGRFAGIYVAEDTVFARIEVNGVTGEDTKGDYISTPATAVKAGTLITTIQTDYFSGITLTSGSVTLILGQNI